MAEKTELETETKRSREQAAAMLQNIADEIGSGEEITIEGNNASITVPGTTGKIGTELEAEHEIRGEYDRVEVEVELEWTIVSEEGDEDRPESDDK
jgi:amphi-Trp domain-containing protein